MSTRSIIHQATLKEWASRIKEQKSSGLSVSEWCHQNNLSKDKYFYWKRQLKTEVVEQALPDIVPLAVPSTPPQSAPIPTTPAVGCENCTSCATFTPTPTARILINGVSIEIDSTASEAFIRSLIKAVRRA